MSLCCIPLTSLLQGTSPGTHAQTAESGSEHSCSGGQIRAGSVWGVTQFATKGDGDLDRRGVSEKFLKEGSSAHG